MGIIAMLMVLVAPAFNSIRSGQNITSAAYTIKGILENARAHALVNNTYAWVGFFEENGSLASTNPATAGIGRLVICTVASKDGTTIYTDVTSPAEDIDAGGTKLVQVGRLLRLDNTHLRTLALGIGDGTDTVAGRPMIPGNSPDNAQIGDTTPPDSLRYFHYPPSKNESEAQYIFRKMFQFSPRGECRPQNDNYTLRNVTEVDIQPVRGNTMDNAKSCAVQISGFSGNVKVYR
jgi:hypothetical protein